MKFIYALVLLSTIVLALDSNTSTPVGCPKGYALNMETKKCEKVVYALNPDWREFYQ